MLDARDVENRPVKSRAFWRVSYAGHVPHQRPAAAFGGHHCNTQQPHSHPPFVYQPPNSPPSRTPPPSASDGDAAAAAATRSLASSPPSMRARPVVHLAPADVGDSGASSFDVVDSMPRSKLPSVRSMGSLVMVGSPEAPSYYAAHRQSSAYHQHGGAGAAGEVHTPSRNGGFMSTSQSMGSLAATPIGGRSSHFPDLGGMRRVRTPCSNGTAASFPSVSPVTPLRTPVPPSVHGSPRRTPVNLPAAAAAGAAADDVTPKNNAAAAAEESPARSMAHFRVVDTRGSAAGVGLRKHARWANSEPLTIGGATTDAIGAAFVEALLATLRGGGGGGASSGTGRSFSSSGGASTPSSPGALPPTPPNSEAGDSDDDSTGGDAPTSAARPPLSREEQRGSFPGIAGNELALTEAFVRHVAAQEAAANPSASNASRAVFSTQAWLRRSRRLQSIGFHGDDASAVDERTAALSAIFEQSFRASTGQRLQQSPATVYPLGGPAPHF